MTFRISDTGAASMVNAFSDDLDGGTFEVWSGSPPANIGDAPAGTLLAVLDYVSPSAPPSATNVATITLPVDGVGIAGGSIGFGRGKSSGGTVIFDGTITLSAGGGDIIASSLSVIIDDVVQITSMNFTQPKE